MNHQFSCYQDNIFHCIKCLRVFFFDFQSYFHISNCIFFLLMVRSTNVGYYHFLSFYFRLVCKNKLSKSSTERFIFWTIKARSTVYRRFETPSDRQPPHMATPFLSFFRTPSFWQDFFNNIATMKHHANTKINSCNQVIHFQKTKKQKLHDLFYKTFISHTRLKVNPK